MAAQNPSRKRAAPGADPAGYSQQHPQGNGTYTNGNGMGQLSDDQFFGWEQPNPPQNAYQEPSMFDPLSVPPAYSGNNPMPSNQIARRPMTQIATRLNTNGGQWMPEPISVKTGPETPTWEDDVDDLEEKAQVAKKDAQTKRKAIPPFVLKLRSFLDDGKNGDLIRWTDDGRSFVVLDEDEFAKKLIPELFKHNNYASFVRQLNMYGFHKKVGLSDNSMRASERKSKSPSEYSNPYFREGLFDLMWLIQKPKNTPTTAKGKGRTKQEGDTGDNADEVSEELLVDSRPRSRPQLTLPDTSNSLTTETMQSVQRELVVIRNQQAQISKMMSAIKREHEQLYGQAATFQDQHTRHENSINAILTFLATVYNKGGLPGQDANTGIANFFNGGAIPQSNTNGNVVDVGDYNFEQFSDMNSVNNNRPLKKQPLLLTDGQSRAQTMSPRSAANSPYVRDARRSSQLKASQSPDTRQVEEIPDYKSTSFTTPQQSTTSVSNQPQQDMMSVIQDTNARNPSPTTPVADFNNVLNNIGRSPGNTTLSNAQRENMLRVISNSTNQTGDNALINAIPPSGPVNFDRQLANTTAGLEALARMQAQQDQSVDKLTNLLQPLSPSGSIPGIGDGQSLPPPPMDIGDLFGGNGEYFDNIPSDGPSNYDFTGNGLPSDNNYNWDPNDDDDELFRDVDTDTNDFSNPTFAFDLNDTSQNGGGRIESVASSEVTTPKHSHAGSDIGEDVGGSSSGGPGTRSKGRKLSTVEETGAQKKRRRS